MADVKKFHLIKLTKNAAFSKRVARFGCSKHLVFIDEGTGLAHILAASDKRLFSDQRFLSQTPSPLLLEGNA